MSVWILLVIFAVLLALGLPVAFCIGIATLAALAVAMPVDVALMTEAQRMVSGLNSFVLLAIPLFILSGVIMGQGGIALRLVNFARCLLGHIPGGLGIVNVVSCTLFGAISGSAVAATSAVGGFLLPEMKRSGYAQNFSAALTACGSITGLLIPPSNILIVYAIASGGVSIAALFIAGYLPGILVSVLLLIVSTIYSKMNGIPVTARAPWRETLKATVDALPALMLIVLIIGGIVGGVFTATEAGAIAVIYSLVFAVCIYREVPLSKLSALMLQASITTAIVMFLVATSVAMSWVLAYESVPESVAQFMLQISDNPVITLIIINLVLLLVGAFMDMTPAVLIFTPIFLPVAVEMGMSPLHFGIMMVLNLSIGLCTPPVGSILFVSCAMAKIKLTQIMRPLMWMYLVLFISLLIVTYVPELSEWLPRKAGLI